MGTILKRIRVGAVRCTMYRGDGCKCCAAIRHVVELLSLLLYQVFVGGETLQLMLRSSFVTLPQNLHVQCTFVKWFSSQLLGEAEVLQVRTWHNCCVARL